MAGVEFLTGKEIADFVDHLDHDKDGFISYQELECQLDNVYQELQPVAAHYNLHHDTRVDERHQFLSSLMGSEKKASIPVEEFHKIVAGWKVPSLEENQQAAKGEDDYLQNISWGRRLRAMWEVDGPQYLFLAFVVATQIVVGVGQCIHYAKGPQYQAALGWGVAFAKTCAGALYPTLFFMLLSMSRSFSTVMRKSYSVSQVVNWDLSQSFHIKMACVAFALATLHAIGHLSGSFVFGSQTDRQAAVAALLGPDAIPKPYMYVSWIRSREGWTGLTALGLFYVLAILSMPCIRKRSYEIFQIGHLLMFPIIGLLMAHGTTALLQFPVLGIVLAIPALFVLCERSLRILSGLHKIPATLEILDDDTVSIACEIPHSRIWTYKAGQYVFLQVPQISFFQWHPFTISTCIGRSMTLHIKTQGDWTGKLRGLKEGIKFVGIHGPFGAPAQRFYDYDQSIIVGAGIGVTPFSGILNDLQTREDVHWNHRRRASKASVELLSSRGPASSSSMPDEEHWEKYDFDKYSRVDFYWIVGDNNHLLWFSDLLNRISTRVHDRHLDIRIHNHVTKKLKDISTHIYRWMLESHRTTSQHVSPLTGLIAPTHFGRPDFPKIMRAHYEDMVKLFARDTSRQRKVGVFFCGAPVIGHTLADLCHQMTLRGREDRTEIEYHFHNEVFA